MFLLIAVFLLMGCTKNSAISEEKRRYFLIAHAGAGDPFWNIVFNGAKEAKKNLGIDVQVLAPENANDIARQVELFNAALASKPDGIAISISDDKAFSKGLREAKKLKIPVIAFNTQPNPTAIQENPFLAFVGMDDVRAGQKLAEQMLRKHELKDHVIVAIHQPGHIGLERRFLGIKSALEPSHIMVEKLDISSDALQAQQILEGYLKKNPSTSALFFLGAFGIHAASRWLEKEYPHLLQASFDLTPLTLEQIKSGALSLSIDQQPFLQGYMSLVELDLAARFHLLPANIDTGVALINQKNHAAIAELVKKGVR